MKAIRFEVAELGVASRMTEATTDAAQSDPNNISVSLVCTPLLKCWPGSAD